MKTAFSTWDNRIAPVFDVARQIHVTETDTSGGIKESSESFAGDIPMQKARHLAELGVNVLVCGAISRQMYAMVAAYGIQVVPFIVGDLREVMDAWMGNRLNADAFAMPGCCGRGRRRFWTTQSREEHMNGRGGGGMGRGGGRGRGRGGRMNRPSGGRSGAGPGGACVCMSCGERLPHQPGVPCANLRCPACGAPMTRE